MAFPVTQQHLLPKKIKILEHNINPKNWAKNDFILPPKNKIQKLIYSPAKEHFQLQPHF
jgi:hypothetical protein